jgi:ABC-type antimicrobial peptide transport system permease subunit
MNGLVGRAHEISVRMSLGAPRRRLLRQFLTESMILSLAGGTVGVLLAIAITIGVVALMPPDYVPDEARITLNSYALLFCAGVSLLTGILFGLAPAIRSSRPDFSLSSSMLSVRRSRSWRKTPAAEPAASTPWLACWE